MKDIKEKEISYAKYGYLFIAPFFIAFLVFQFISVAHRSYRPWGRKRVRHDLRN